MSTRCVARNAMHACPCTCGASRLAGGSSSPASCATTTSRAVRGSTARITTRLPKGMRVGPPRTRSPARISRVRRPLGCMTRQLRGFPARSTTRIWTSKMDTMRANGRGTDFKIWVMVMLRTHHYTGLRRSQRRCRLVYCGRLHRGDIFVYSTLNM